MPLEDPCKPDLSLTSPPQMVFISITALVQHFLRTLLNCKVTVDLMQCSAVHYTALHCTALHITKSYCSAFHCSALNWSGRLPVNIHHA